VTREVLELHAAIKRGDSGGPLVLPDGTIGGLVFAESRSQPDVGYALTPTEVATKVAPALERTTAVSNGACSN
jgi:S1-C subfamily serine protease